MEQKDVILKNYIFGYSVISKSVKNLARFGFLSTKLIAHERGKDFFPLYNLILNRNRKKKFKKASSIIVKVQKVIKNVIYFSDFLELIWLL